MNTTQLVAAVQFWDNFNMALYLRILENKYKITIKTK